LVALDAATGIVRWSVPVSTDTADPVASDGSVVALTYITLVDGVRWPDLGVFDAATGAPLWVRKIRDVEQWPTTQPVVTEAFVYLGAQNGDVVALDKVDGKRAWRRNVGNFLDGIEGAGATILATAGQELYALNATTGKQRWRWASKSTTMSPRTMPGVAQDAPIVLFAAAPGEDGRLIALDPGTGKPAWRTDAGPSDFNAGSPVLAGGRIVMVLNSSDAASVVSFGTP
jgi:outer membrane protein assembly factor BamB